MTDLLSFIRASLPPPPSRVLEIGAGDGELARTLRDDGYDVLAIDPDPRGEDIRPLALGELDDSIAPFDAALAVTSLHHVEPLEPSITRLADALEPGAVLVVDEFDVGTFDEPAAEWWLRQRRALGGEPEKSAAELVAEHRAHLHPLPRIVAALEPQFEVEAPVYGPYLYRWNLAESLRDKEVAAIAGGEIPAVGARFVARLRPPG
ncbi:MAG TPA: class I SAM-dependent methyltransferase [Gaiellaceae bacterium]|nr:class I SAM-dependent methyltransferase [Gaiellaceae bacterium]